VIAMAALGAHRTAAGSARVDAGGTGELGDGGRTRGRNGRRQNHEGSVVHAQAAVPQTVPEHLPRERVIVPGPTACNCCGGLRLSRLGEDIHRTLEVIAKSWKVIQHVREKFTCRDCEKISQAPAPFHVIARGWAGPSPVGDGAVREVWPASAAQPAGGALCQEGVPISLSTLADQVGGCMAALMPLFKRLEAYC